MLESLLSSRVRAKLLTAFFLDPGTERNAWELAQSLNEYYSSVWKELKRLEELGILKSTAKGNAKEYWVDPTCPIAPELRAIVLKTAGVGEVLRAQIPRIGKIKEAFIYGSYASGRADAKSDIDLMIIGEVDLEKFAPIIDKVEKELNRPVNYIIYSEEEWNEKIARQEPFAVNVNESPRIIIVGDKNAL